MRRDAPPRRTLLLRLLALSALVSLCSIAATAWLTARTTTGAIRQEQHQVLADQVRIYHELLGYAATHPDWTGAEPTVRRLAADTGQRILLATPRFEPVVDSAAATPAAAPSATAPDSAAGRTNLPRTPTTTVDPLSVDLAMLPDAPADRIDARALGPFRMTAAERAAMEEAARDRADCLRSALGVEATVTDDAAGHPVVNVPGGQAASGVRCASPQVLDAPTGTESAALADLTGLVNACLERQRIRPVQLSLSLQWTPSRDREQDQVVSACLANSRRQQLVRYVAPPVLLFVGAPSGTAEPAPVLSAPHRGRVVEVAALVLAVTVAITTAVGLRLSRPLNALTRAARRMADGDLSARVTATGRDEIAGLAAAFNAMAERREQLEELRRAMVGDIAHELRTPLSNIRGWLEAVEDGVVTADGALTSSLLEEALLLQHLIDDLRDLAAADAGELALHREPVDAEDLLAQAATAHGALAQASGVTLVVDTDTATAGCELSADPVRLRQMVGNLVANAVRHTPAGGTVTLRTRPEAHALLIEVADTGNGIAPADLPLVFERFWRAEKSRNRQSGGSGLGLAIVRKLAELHGGAVHAASTPGTGSVFTVCLPRTAAAPPEALGSGRSGGNRGIT
ncbi:HAMP domain-containing protein [Kitasatospora xanthocidica]|uniref:histidine kinase n=1 Tax=Kitasatospora xanthocidica TaxID=83382 RepID=A0A372ZMT6_9ACTN|nr:ATP-binding protein [Kitasatospora xanthocidica]RGD57208.1 HAMP domain-containing protein [Kitasatospora xanthocidica]